MIELKEQDFLKMDNATKSRVLQLIAIGVVKVVKGKEGNYERTSI